MLVLGGSYHEACASSTLQVLRLSLEDVSGAVFEDDSDGVLILLSSDASARMESFTSAHIGKTISIILEGEQVAVASVHAPISNGAIFIRYQKPASRVLKMLREKHIEQREHDSFENNTKPRHHPTLSRQ